MPGGQYILGVDFGSTHTCARLYSRNLNLVASKSLPSLKAGGHLLYWMTRSPRFKALASYRLRTTLACIRLKHLLDSRPKLLADCRRGSVYFGCLETWFLWRLTGGNSFFTDLSCASVTGMFDPFTKKWSNPIMNSLGIPQEILPTVQPTSHLFGHIQHGPLRVPAGVDPIPVTALIGDAQAATLTENCLGPGQAKLTLGTGSFLNLSTGHRAAALMEGFYPVIGWASSYAPAETLSTSSGTCGITQSSHQTRSSVAAAAARNLDLTYLLEGSHPNTGTLIEWLRTNGMFNTYTELEEMLFEGDRQGLDERAAEYGAFYLTVPPNLLRKHQMLLKQTEHSMGRKLMGPDGTLVGLDLLKSPERLLQMLTVRLVMESIAFTVRQMLERCRKEAGLSPPVLRVNGNVAKSDWLLQRLADVTGIPIERSAFEESSCLGSAIAAGVGACIWPDYATATRMLHHQKSIEMTDPLSPATLPSVTHPVNPIVASGSYREASPIPIHQFEPHPIHSGQLQARYRSWCRARSNHVIRLRLTRLTEITSLIGVRSFSFACHSDSGRSGQLPVSSRADEPAGLVH